ncbi:MAG: hypothetical protein WD990_14065 [Acidimicrobiia bacterium]
MTTLAADMSDTFRGRARILDLNGMLIDVGKADLHRLDPDTGSTWGGTIRVFVNASLATKSVESILALENGNQAHALVGPQVGGVVDGELVDVKVVALQTDVPF